MRNSKPQSYALVVSISVMLVFSIMVLILDLFIDKHDWLIVGLFSFFVFVVSYFIYRFFLERFIYDRIKLLYKTIHILKSPRQEAPFFHEQDMMNNAEDDVIKWAQAKKEEIDQLQKSETYRREFVGNVSHELKTPIFNIQGYILTLLDGGMEDPSVNKLYLERAEKNINRMISIVEDLEVISQLESGELILHQEAFDIIALTKEVFESLEIKTKRKNITLYFGDSYPTPIWVMADKNRLRQVITNLLENSIKYSNENGRTKISFFDMDENILVEIADNGIGIDVNHLPRIFERFYRVDKSRSREQGGSGLGLAIVKHIIEAHSQTIHVRSKLGIGTTFGFTLKKEGK